MTLAEFWPQCLSRLHNTLTPQLFNMWIAPLTVDEGEETWVVYGKNQFTVNMIQNQFAQLINTIHNELAPNQPSFTFKVGKGQTYAMAPDTAVADTEITHTAHKKASTSNTKNDLIERIKNLPTKKNKPKDNHTTSSTTEQTQLESEHKPHLEKSKAKQSKQYSETHLSPEYTFGTLVEGKGNQVAVAIGKSVAEIPGNTNYNPFFIYGSTGLGKTHLAQAVGNELIKNHPDAKVRYMHSDEYIRSLMNAVRTSGYDAFKQQYKPYDLLIIDDIQFIKGKDRTMEEFFHLYNHFLNEKKQLILTCDVLPKDIEDMDDRLKSRFSWGLTMQLEPPELEMRVAILQKKAKTSGIDLDEQAAFFIAKHIRNNVRELEGAFKRVEAHSRFKKQPINIDLATEALQDIVASSYKIITVDLIIDSVARYYHIKISDILSKKRNRNIARPRQIAMSLAKELTNLSLPAIGEAFSGRDHTTIMHGIKAIAKLRAEDPELAQDYDKLLIVIKN